MLVTNIVCFLFYWTVLSVEGQSLSTCNVRLNPFDYPTSGKALGATFYIDINNPFTCHGVITKWRICYKSSPGALYDTIKIGVYQPDSDGDQFTKKGSNSIHLQLQSKDCLNITADPQLVVQQGYVIAFYASLTYIKFFDDTANGYLYKSVAFPNSISKGVLIKTSSPYAPKIQAYVEMLSPPPLTPTIFPTSTNSFSTSLFNISSIKPSETSSSDIHPSMSSSYVASTNLPEPTSEFGIPFPDLAPNECSFGVDEAFAKSFKRNSSIFVNYLLPSECNGIIERWELCHKFVENVSSIYVGVWRLPTYASNESELVLIGENKISILPRGEHHIDPLACTTVALIDDNITYEVQEGDLIGFHSSDIFMAFTNENIKRDTNQPLIPLLRAIIKKQITSSEASPSIIPSISPSIVPFASNNVIGAIFGSIVGVASFVALLVLIVIVSIIVCRKINSFDRTTNREEMLYNVNYVPSDDNKIILDNKKITLRNPVKRNPSYSSVSIVSQLGNLPKPPPLNNSNHIYESI